MLISRGAQRARGKQALNTGAPRRWRSHRGPRRSATREDVPPNVSDALPNSNPHRWRAGTRLEVANRQTRQATHPQRALRHRARRPDTASGSSQSNSRARWVNEKEPYARTHSVTGMFHNTLQRNAARRGVNVERRQFLNDINVRRSLTKGHVVNLPSTTFSLGRRNTLG